jgi:hypothetical protein
MTTSKDKVTISQEQYILNKLNTIEIKDDEMTEEEKVQEYRHMVGTAMWVRITRPEIAYELACLARGIMNPMQDDAERLNKLIKYLEKTSTDKRIITTLGGKLSILTFADASFATLPDLKSQAGVVTVVAGDKCSTKVVAIAVTSRKIKRKCPPPFDSECLAAVEGAGDAMSYAALLEEGLYGTRPGLVEMMSRRSLGLEPAEYNLRRTSAALLTDSNGVCTAVAGTKQVDCKRRRIDIDHLRECIELMDLASLQHVQREYNVADAVTATRSPGTASNTRLRAMLYQAT